jgi:prevent-host-death family protein
VCYYDHDQMTMGICMQVPAGEFKAKCLKLMEQVARTRRAIVITKRGKPVAKLVPPDEPEPRTPFFGYMAGIGEIRGDIVNEPSVEWSALTGDEDELYAGLDALHSESESPRAKKHRRK